MKTYEYRGYGTGGKFARGLVEALSVKEAREKLAARGILAEKIGVVDRSVRLSADRRATIYRELGELLRAGLPLVRALDVLIESPVLGESTVVLAGVRDRVRDGKGLADAFRAGSDSVTLFEHAIVEAAEKSATVDVMLDRLAGFLEEQERLKDRVRNALIYPLVVVTLGICIATLMIGLLIPRTKEIFESVNVQLPLLTKFMIAFGTWFLRWLWLIVLVPVAAMMLLRRRIASDEDFRVKWDRWLFGLPLFGRGYMLLVNQRFAKTMAILLEGGVSLIDSFALSGRATGSLWVARMAKEGAETVRHGANLSDVVGRIAPLAETLPEWIKIGEAGGGLARLLSDAGEKYRYRWEKFVNRSLSVFEMALIFAVGAFVLIIVLSILLPIFSLTRVIGH